MKRSNESFPQSNGSGADFAARFSRQRFTGQVPGLAGQKSIEPKFATPRQISDFIHGPSKGSLEFTVGNAANETGLDPEVIQHVFVTRDGDWQAEKFGQFMSSLAGVLERVNTNFPKADIVMDDILAMIHTDCVNRSGEIILPMLEQKLGLRTPFNADRALVRQIKEERQAERKGRKQQKKEAAQQKYPGNGRIGTLR